MYKVILRVEKLLLKLNNIQGQIFAKKDSFSFPLSHKFTIQNGQAVIAVQTEFLVVQNDPTFLIQASLISKGSRKLGGQLRLNVSQWDENVHHSMVASLKKSPDTNAHISYKFLYIRKNQILAERTLILCSQGRYQKDQGLVEIEGLKKQLTKRNDKLQDQIKKLKEENSAIQKNEKDKIQGISTMKSDHEKKIKICLESIEKNTQKNDRIKKKNQEIMRMIKEFGKEETKRELQKMYPTGKGNPASEFQKEFRTVETKTQKSMQKCVQDERTTRTSRIKRKNSCKNSSQSQISENSCREERQRSRQKKALPRRLES